MSEARRQNRGFLCQGSLGTASCVRGISSEGLGPRQGGCRKPGQGRILRGQRLSSGTWGGLGPGGRSDGHLSRGEGLMQTLRSPARPGAPRSPAPMCSSGPQATWPGRRPAAAPGLGSGCRPACDPVSAPPAQAAAGRLGPRPGRGRGHGGRSGRPAPGVCPGARAATLRTGRGRAGARGPGSGAEFESAPRGAMASSGPAGPLLLLLVLLEGARAGLPLRPGRGCYRAPRGDRLAHPARRSAAGASRAPASWGPCRLLGVPCLP